MISVVIRTKNEERWIGRCLAAVSAQDRDDVEIIVVDNESVDKTLEIALAHGCRIVTISDAAFAFGRALNLGIQAAKGVYIAILSGHCIPLNDKWLDRLLRNFGDSGIVGVYGRQEPLPDSSSFDKRDLWNSFGLDRRVQERDYFFHNANAMIRRDAWEVIPFDEGLTGVEDRHWAKRVLERGWRIAYDPEAGVYHFHGINHGRDERRAERVVKVIELIDRGKSGH